MTTGLVADLNADSFSEKHLLKYGDVLFAAKGSRNFAVHFDLVDMPAAASTSFFVIKITEENILPEYLTWYLNHPITMSYLKAFAKGTSMVSISKEVLNDLEVKIPSLEKQKLIFKIDKLRSSETQIQTKLLSLNQALHQQQLYNAIS